MPPSRTGPESAGFRSFATSRLAEAGLALRPATEADREMIAAVYATTRDEELRQVPWTDAEKRAFTEWQSGQQEAHYALHYPAAERLVIERDVPIGRIYVAERLVIERDVPIGRIYVDTAGREVRLMEVTLFPAWRNQGIGTRLTRVLVEYADALGLPASLHVEPFNPAKRMYERLGFAVAEARGLYEFMVRPARVPVS